MANQSDTELVELLNQLMSHITKDRLLISEILSKLVQEKNNTSNLNLKINSLINQIIDEMNENSIPVTEVSTLFSSKMKSGISDTDLTSLQAENSGKAKKIALTAAEISALWLQYMGDSMAVCVYKYFLQIVENQEIKPILESALQLAESHITQNTQFLKSANFQVPVGFTEHDVNLKAPRLFTDQFLLFYTYIMTIHGITAYGLAITNMERQDIQDHFFECLATSKELFQQIVNLAKNSPNFSSVPTIPSPHGAKVMSQTGVIANLMGDKRPLNGSEISNLFFNSKKTGLIKSLSLAFSQVAELEEVRKFMQKNAKFAGKDVESFDTILQQDNLPIPEKWDADITDSTVSPFSDKLIMFHAAFLVNAALSYYGASLGSSLRSDIIVNYNKVFTHAMQAGALCYNMMVKHGWLEKQPEAIDRKSLYKS